MKSFCLFIILSSATLHGHAQKNGVLTTIFSSYEFKNIIYVGKSDNLTEAKILKEFERDVTSLVIHKDYLYISLTRNHVFSKDSAIWRAIMTDSEDFEVDPESWEEFQVMNNLFDDITSLAVAEGYIYAGLSDDSIMRCSTEEKNSCEIFKEFGFLSVFYQLTGMTPKTPIVGVDYDPVHRRIYALSHNTLRSCSIDNNEKCKSVDVEVGAGKISTLKVAFNAVWLGVDIQKMYTCALIFKCSEDSEYFLLKSPINKDLEYDFEYFEEYFGEKSLIHYFSNTNQHLYFSFEKSEKIRRCGPNDSMSCRGSISKPRDMDKFIIVP